MLTYAGTATRWAQRLIVALAVLLDLPIFTIDVTGAFAKGLNWEEIAELTVRNRAPSSGTSAPAQREAASRT